MNLAQKKYALDVETSIIEGTPDAWRAGAHIALSGTLSSDGICNITPGTGAVEALIEALPSDGNQLVIMHNGAFDLCHVIKALGNRAVAWLLSPNVALWDTQTVDYLIQRCGVQMPSLEESGARYGVAIAKDPWASEAFDAGIGADILYKHDPARITRYLESDLVGTLALQRAQRLYINARMPRLEKVLITQGRVLKLMALCIHYGLPVDQLLLTEAARANYEQMVRTQKALTAAIGALIESVPARKEFNISSPKQLAALLYGGEIIYNERVQIGFYATGAKVGEPRYKIVKHPVQFPPLYPMVEGASTDDAALRALITTPCAVEGAAAVLPLLVKSRELAKLDSTYYKPIQQKTAQSELGRLHGKFNMSMANTGRKTSSAPNLQNLPEDIRACVKAPPGYKIMIVDAKQLEVVGWAYMSGDRRLRRILQKGGDVHGIIKARVDEAAGLDIERTNVKRAVFGRIYGGGASRLSQQSGIPEDVVKAIIKTFDAMFPEGRDYFKLVRSALEKNATYENGPDGVPVKVSYFELPSGRQLRFVANSPSRKGGMEFSFTEMKNRPIQSFATADIVPYIEQHLVALFGKRPEIVLERRVIPLAVVHDELVLQVRDDSIDNMQRFFTALSAQLPARLTKWYGLDPIFDLPLAMDCGIGDTWAAAKNAAGPLKCAPLSDSGH